MYGAKPRAALEVADALRELERKSGYIEREVFIAQTGFDWSQLRSASNARALFATQHLLELGIPTGKPGKVAECDQPISRLIARRNPDTRLAARDRRAGQAGEMIHGAGDYGDHDRNRSR